MAERPGMMFYHSKYSALAGLDDHDFRTVMDALMHTSMTGERAELDGMLGVVYSVLVVDVLADFERYDAAVAKRREAGRKGAASRWQTMANDGNAILPDSKNGKHGQIQSQYQIQYQIQNQSQYQSSSSQTLPQTGGTEEEEKRVPTLEEIQGFAQANGMWQASTAVIQRFLADQNERGWKDARGNLVLDWRAWFRGWYAKNVHVEPEISEEDRRRYNFV